MWQTIILTVSQLTVSQLSQFTSVNKFPPFSVGVYKQGVGINQVYVILRMTKINIQTSVECGIVNIGYYSISGALSKGYFTKTPRGVYLDTPARHLST